MNIYYLILMSLFLYVKGGNVPSVDTTITPPLNEDDVKCDQHSLHSSWPFDHIKLRILRDKRVIARVDLKPTKRVLANKYLPVWFSRTIVSRESLYNEDEHNLERDNQVMEQLGEFTTYHDAKTSSAAIYFHKEHELDGIIGYELLIQKLSIDKFRPIVEKSIVLDEDGVYSRLGYKGHEYSLEDNKEDPDAGVNYQGHLRTYGSHVYDGYPEVLVIVSTEVAEEWTSSLDESESHTTIVSHVLTLFNAVDMLYSKLMRTNIQINIAGIIVEDGHTFKFLEDCYYSAEVEDGRIEYRLEGSCNNDLLRTYLYARRKEIPTDSYDMVIHLTRENLYMIKEESVDDNEIGISDISLVGISHMIPELFKTRSTKAESILIGTITYPDYLENYPTIAHEMAHLMTVKHDKIPFFTQDFSCCGHMMKTIGGFCEHCLSWSDISEETFYLFFSSPNCCTFINDPRSLYPVGPREMLTADEQCQCYGYESAKKSNGGLESFCQSKLQCKGMKDKFFDVIVPMDGTPCGDNKVCWLNLCEETEIQKILVSLG